MLRLIAAVTITAVISTSAQSQMVNCSNVYRPECSKSPYAPSRQGYAYGPYGYGYDGGPPPAYYGGGYGYYRRGPYGPYGPYGYWRGPGY
jgi:hypothetical protein